MLFVQNIIYHHILQIGRSFHKVKGEYMRFVAFHLCFCLFVQRFGLINRFTFVLQNSCDIFVWEGSNLIFLDNLTLTVSSWLLDKKGLTVRIKFLM